VFAGAALDDLFVSSAYRQLTAEVARHHPEALQEILDFEAKFNAVDTETCTPLLARYDRIIELDCQRSCYAGTPLSILNRGHVIGSLATEKLRTHIVEQLLVAPTCWLALTPTLLASASSLRRSSESPSLLLFENSSGTVCRLGLLVPLIEDEVLLGAVPYLGALVQFELSPWASVPS
jgi:hypothetical protein